MQQCEAKRGKCSHGIAKKLVLAVDLGTSGMKVALITISGRVLAWESEPVRLLITPDGGAEQSPDEWWAAFLSAAGRLLKRDAGYGASVRAVCCSTQGEGTVAVDKDGNALMNCILWMDMRGAPYLREQFKGLVNVTGAGLLNTLRWIRLTGGMPSMTGKDPAGHMLLVRERFPEIYARTYKFLNVLDYLNLRLTGRFTATFELDPDLLGDRQPRPGCDPLRRRPGAPLGHRRRQIPRDCALYGDPGAAQTRSGRRAGAFMPRSRWLPGRLTTPPRPSARAQSTTIATHLYIGTSSWMAAHVPFKKTDIGSSLASVPCAVPGRYLLTALQATAGGNLTFLRDNILYHKDELLQEADVPDIFKVLDQITARVPAGANGVIYTPWIWGERAPVDDKTVRAGLYNLSLNNNRRGHHPRLPGRDRPEHALAAPAGRKIPGSESPVDQHRWRRCAVGCLVPDFCRCDERRNQAGRRPDLRQRARRGLDCGRRPGRNPVQRRAPTGAVQQLTNLSPTSRPL